MDTCNAGPHRFDFDDHIQGHAGPRYFAINVKFHSWPAVSEKHEKKLDRLKEIGRVKEDQLQNAAFDNACENWWEWAKELAGEYGLGKVYSAGRCGGWLVLDEVLASDVEDLCWEYNRECLNCGKPWEHNHADDGKCLYNSTTWETDYEANLDRLLKLEKFQSEILASKDWANQVYQENLEYYIDEEWEQCVDEKKRERDEKRHRRAAVAAGLGAVVAATLG